MALFREVLIFFFPLRNVRFKTQNRLFLAHLACAAHFTLFLQLGFFSYNRFSFTSTQNKTYFQFDHRLKGHLFT